MIILSRVRLWTGAVEEKNCNIVWRSRAVQCREQYPRDTRHAARGQIRNSNRFSSTSTFRYRAMQYYNSVPVSVRTGSTATVKRKLKKWIKANIPID